MYIKNKAKYSYSNINDCLLEVSNFQTTTVKKSEHKIKEYEIYKLYNFCLEKTNCILFSPINDYYYCEYKKLIGLNATKKELDNILKRCLKYLKYELSSIKKLMDSEEVDSIA